MGSRIKVSEIYANRYYRIPMQIFRGKYKVLSNNARLLYGILDNRRELSQKNNWIDEENNIYLIFSRKEAEELLCVSNVPVTKAFHQLIEIGLIDEVKRGLNMPNLIYVCHVDLDI